jgi:hypothetical protein
MDEQRMEQIVDALQRYFDRADPDNDDFNARLIQDDLKLYGGELLLLAPAVIIDGLRNAVDIQVRQQIFLGADDDSLDSRLKGIGLMLFMEYASLIKAAGGGGVLALTLSLPLLLKQDEDVVTIIAYTLGTLARSRSPLIASAVTSTAELVRDLFQQAYNTSCKIALAYALFQCGSREPFKSYAVPRLARPEQRRILEQMLTPGDLRLQAWVVGALIMDIASKGNATHPVYGWQHKR